MNGVVFHVLDDRAPPREGEPSSAAILNPGPGCTQSLRGIDRVVSPPRVESFVERRHVACLVEEARLVVRGLERRLSDQQAHIALSVARDQRSRAC
jgi:hypothetical protein